MNTEIKYWFSGCTITLICIITFNLTYNSDTSEPLSVKTQGSAAKSISPPERPITSIRNTNQSIENTPEKIEQPLNPTEHEKTKTRGNEIASQMLNLAQEVDKNLAIPEQRKQIQTEYLKLTQEYNQLAIQLVKAERAAQPVSE